MQRVQASVDDLSGVVRHNQSVSTLHLWIQLQKYICELPHSKLAPGTTPVWRVTWLQNFCSILTRITGVGKRNVPPDSEQPPGYRHRHPPRLANCIPVYRC